MKPRIQLENFEILREFKGNSCNKIYLAADKQTPATPIIYKKIKIYDFQTQLREIKAQKNLHHKFIVRLLDYEIQEQHIVLLIEYVPNGDLFEFINNIETIRESVLLRLFYKIVIALHFIHLNGFVHRDIKPENILMDGDTPKLADFGSSVADEVIRNTFCGTYEYMAPEINLRLPQTSKVDVWALGILLFEMTHNRTPFKDLEVMRVKQILETKTIDFDQQISPKIRSIIYKILQFAPNHRPSTAEILKFPELKRFYTELKPELLEIYQDHSIKKLKLAKSCQEGFENQKNSESLKIQEKPQSLKELPLKNNFSVKTKNQTQQNSKIAVKNNFTKNYATFKKQKSKNKKYSKKRKGNLNQSSIQELEVIAKTNDIKKSKIFKTCDNFEKKSKIFVKNFFKRNSGSRLVLAQNFKKKLKEMSINKKKKLKHLPKKIKNFKKAKSKEKKENQNETKVKATQKPNNKIENSVQTSKHFEPNETQNLKQSEEFEKSTAENTVAGSIQNSNQKPIKKHLDSKRPPNKKNLQISSQKSLFNKFFSKRSIYSKEWGNTSLEKAPKKFFNKPDLGKKIKKPAQKKKADVAKSFRNISSKIPSFLKYNENKKYKSRKIRSRNQKIQSFQNKLVKKRDKIKNKILSNLVSKDRKALNPKKDLQKSFASQIKIKKNNKNHDKGRKVGCLATAKRVVSKNLNELADVTSDANPYQPYRKESNHKMILTRSQVQPNQSQVKQLSKKNQNIIKSIKSISISRTHFSVPKMYSQVKISGLEGASLKPKGLAESSHYLPVSYPLKARDSELSRKSQNLQKTIYQTKNSGIVNFQYQSIQNLKPRKKKGNLSIKKLKSKNRSLSKIGFGRKKIFYSTLYN